MSETSWLPQLRPHHRTVARLRAAASARDLRRVRAPLDPDVAVVVDSGEPEHAKVRVVRGVEDASLLLAHGLGAQRGLEVAERAVNGSPGLLLSRDGRRTASIAVDLIGGLVSVVWVRLDPVPLRRGNVV